MMERATRRRIHSPGVAVDPLEQYRNGEALLRLLQIMYCEGAPMTAESLTTLCHLARLAGAKGPLQSWSCEPRNDGKVRA